MQKEKFIQKGILPLEGESKEDFLIRGLNFLLLEKKENSLKNLALTDDEIEKGLVKIKTLFNMEPSWIPLCYSKKKSLFFGGFFIFDEEENPPLYLELNPLLKKRKNLLSHKKEEIIAHECVHAIRVMLEEPRFEEILAYQTSTSPFLTFFGPLFQKTSETYLLLTLFFLSSLTSLLSLVSEAFFFLSLCILSFAFSLLLVAFFRLFFSQRIFKKAYKNIRKTTENPLFILIQSTDAEIEAFARGN